MLPDRTNSTELVGAGFGSLTDEVLRGQCAAEENTKAFDSQREGQNDTPVHHLHYQHKKKSAYNEENPYTIKYTDADLFIVDTHKKSKEHYNEADLYTISPKTHTKTEPDQFFFKAQSLWSMFTIDTQKSIQHRGFS